ncbi:MAG: sigma-70 family RNA polymerase sigma factor [Clostridia bacterium]|nr:sigma-70 family RNA polymerase sigma factor [Clostridia bacterium]
MEDRQIVELFLKRSEDALKMTAEKYGPYLQTVAREIVGSRQDAEECVNDTYMSAWNSIPPKQPEVLQTYLCKLCRRHALMRLRYNNAEKRGGGTVPLPLHEIEELVPGEADETEAEAIREAVRRFIAGLDGDEKNVFLQRYFYFSDIKSISIKYGFSQSKVKMTLKRCRDRLRALLESEGLL